MLNKLFLHSPVLVTWCRSCFRSSPLDPYHHNSSQCHLVRAGSIHITTPACALPYPILLRTAFITRDLPKVDQLQLASRSSCTLPSSLPVGADDSHRLHHGCVPHKPFDYRVADWNVGPDVVLKPNLQRSNLPLDKSDRGLRRAIRLWVVLG